MGAHFALALMCRVATGHFRWQKLAGGGVQNEFCDISAHTFSRRDNDNLLLGVSGQIRRGQKPEVINVSIFQKNEPFWDPREVQNTPQWSANTHFHICWRMWIFFPESFLALSARSIQWRIW